MTSVGWAWNGTNHRGLDPDDGNLYAWAPADVFDENGYIMVGMGGAAEKLYAENRDGVWVPVSSLEPVDSYDSTTGQMKKPDLKVKQLTAETSELNDFGIGWYYTSGNPSVSHLRYEARGREEPYPFFVPLFSKLAIPYFILQT